MAIILICGPKAHDSEGRRQDGRAAVAVAGAVGVLVLGACASAAVAHEPDTVGDCPGGRIPIVVTVDQWGDIVGRLGGACGDVTTIITGHDGRPPRLRADARPTWPRSATPTSWW